MNKILIYILMIFSGLSCVFSGLMILGAIAALQYSNAYEVWLWIFLGICTLSFVSLIILGTLLNIQTKNRRLYKHGKH